VVTAVCLPLWAPITSPVRPPFDPVLRSGALIAPRLASSGER
jgi:hypothetical protein